MKSSGRWVNNSKTRPMPRAFSIGTFLQLGSSGKRQRRLSDGYSFAGFGAKETLRGVFGDPDVRIVRLDRRSKKRFAAVVSGSPTAGTTGGWGRVRASLDR